MGKVQRALLLGSKVGLLDGDGFYSVVELRSPGLSITSNSFCANVLIVGWVLWLLRWGVCKVGSGNGGVGRCSLMRRRARVTARD